MENERSLFVKCAMVYGLVMGFFWVFKYVFFVWGVSVPAVSLVYWGLTLSGPFLLALLIVHSRIYIRAEISFVRDWAMGILIFFFAALIVSLAHYLFYRYFAPPDYIADGFKSAVDVLKGANVNEKLREAVETMPTPTPIQMAIQGIFNNTLYGVLVALPVAAITSRLKIRIIHNNAKE